MELVASTDLVEDILVRLCEARWDLKLLEVVEDDHELLVCELPLLLQLCKLAIDGL